MPRDFNDIIPPSRRKHMGLEEQAKTQPQVAGPAETPNRYQQSNGTPEAPVSTEQVAPAEDSYMELPKQARKFMRPTLPAIGSSFPFGTAIVAILVLAGCAAVLYSFSGAKVVITPVHSPATISGDLTAYKDTGDLTFEQVLVEKTATVDVKGSGVKEANDSASGKITIRNAQTNQQALIKNTRFQSENGLIYRIRDSIVVPASGTLTVTVYADEAGENFNIGPTTFTIPGLKGGKAYDLVTAKSEAAMNGGFRGQRASVEEDMRQKSYESLKTELTTSLQKELATKVPSGYVLVQGTSVTGFEPVADTTKGGEQVTLAMKGTLRAVIFPEEVLARAVAFKALGSYDGSPVHFDSVQGLTIKPAGSDLPPDATQYAFSIAGNANIIWKVDKQKIAGAVAGKTRESAEMALKSFLELDKATLVLRPFWTSTFPVDPDKIAVTVTGESPAK